MCRYLSFCDHSDSVILIQLIYFLLFFCTCGIKLLYYWFRKCWIVTFNGVSLLLEPFIRIRRVAWIQATARYCDPALLWTCCQTNPTLRGILPRHFKSVTFFPALKTSSWLFLWCVVVVGETGIYVHEKKQMLNSGSDQIVSNKYNGSFTADRFTWAKNWRWLDFKNWHWSIQKPSDASAAMYWFS